MATSIIEYNKKYLDVNDNILIFSLYFIKIVAVNKDIPNWFKDYKENVIDVMINMRPVGFGYMDLEEYLAEDDNKKQFYLEVINDTIIYLKRRKSDIVDNIEANYILSTKGLERWKETSFIKTEHIIKFLEDIKILLDDNTPLNHERLMKTIL